jgi:ferredoxin
MSLEIQIDARKCRGHGLCTIAAPQIFELVGLGMARAAGCDLSNDKLRAAAERAARYCCEGAISLEDRA